MSKIHKYTCNHVYKETSLLPKTILIDDLCPDCKKKIQKIQSFYEFEDNNGLLHFPYSISTLQKALIATETRFKVLKGISSPFLSEDGLWAYLEALMGDLRPQADELIRRANIIIKADMNFWYSWRNKTCEELITYIEIGDMEDL